MKNSLFIVFEGGEGSGKTTQARLLYKRLSRLGIPVILTHEPGGTPLGNRICSWLKRADSISPHAELLLFAASRAQLVAKVIQPRLEDGINVICDRYIASTIAYQGYGRGLDLDVIETTNALASGGLQPDIVVLLDIAVKTGLARKESMVKDRFEREGLAFHRRVRDGYLAQAAADPERWLVVDGSLSKPEIGGFIWEKVKELFK